MLYKTMTKLEHHLEEHAGASTTDISDSEIHVVQAWAQPSKRHMKLGLWYGHNHPVDKTIYNDKGMVATIPSKSHVCNHKPIHAAQTYVILVRGLETLTDLSTNSSMRINVLRSNMIESLFITGQ